MKADQKLILNRLNRIKGQIDGIIKMVEDDQYCLDISNQILAVNSALKSTNREIISAHLQSCLTDTFYSDNKKEIEQKIEEIEKLIIKLGK